MLTLALALVLAWAAPPPASPLLRLGIGAPAYAYLAVPAVVLALGFFLLVRGFGIEPGTRPRRWSSIIANALLALPFAVATLGPPLEPSPHSRGKLIRSLGLSGWRQFAPSNGRCSAARSASCWPSAFCFSLGDLGVISLFGTEDFATLPLLMLRALGAYRSNDAAAIAALMLAADHCRLRRPAAALREARRCSSLDDLTFAHPGQAPPTTSR